VRKHDGGLDMTRGGQCIVGACVEYAVNLHTECSGEGVGQFEKRGKGWVSCVRREEQRLSTVLGNTPLEIEVVDVNL
jgi:hypothetical protein